MPSSIAVTVLTPTITVETSTEPTVSITVAGIQGPPGPGGGGGGGAVDSVTATAPVIADNTDTANPVISIDPDAVLPTLPTNEPGDGVTQYLLETDSNEGVNTGLLWQPLENLLGLQRYAVDGGGAGPYDTITVETGLDPSDISSVMFLSGPNGSTITEGYVDLTFPPLVFRINEPDTAWSVIIIARSGFTAHGTGSITGTPVAKPVLVDLDFSSLTTGHNLVDPSSPQDIDTPHARDAAIATETTNRTNADALLIPLTQKGANNGVATLDSGGKVPSGQIPAIPLGHVFTASSDAGMIALSSAVPGDTCIRTDKGYSYQLSAAPPSTLANWLALDPGGNVVSVNGQQGIVTGLAEQVDLTTEVTNRTNADTTLQTNINTETTNRANADALLIPLAQRGAASGIPTLSANSDLVTPAATLTNSDTIVGGAWRTASGLLVTQAFDITQGPIFGTIAAGSNGVNVNTFTGSGVINVSSTVGASNAGKLTATTAGGTTPAHITYTGKTSTTFTGCTTTSGSGTLGTGALWATHNEDDQLWGSPLTVVYSPTIDYASGVVGPQTRTSFPNAIGQSFPRGVIELEGITIAKQSLDPIQGIGPWIQNLASITNDPGVAANLTPGIGFTDAMSVMANAQTVTAPPPSGGFNQPGGTATWSIPYWSGRQWAGLTRGAISGSQHVDYLASVFVWGGSSAVYRAGFMALETELTNTIGSPLVPGTGSITTQVGFTVGQYGTDGTARPTKWTRATNNIGIENASTTVLIEDRQVVAAGFTIAPTASLVTLTSAGPVTSASGTMITSPSARMDGQTLKIVNGNTTAGRSITLSGTNVIMGGPIRVLSPGGSIEFVYVSAAGAWVENAHAPGTLGTAFGYAAAYMDNATGSDGVIAWGTGNVGFPVAQLGFYKNLADFNAANPPYFQMVALNNSMALNWGLGGVGNVVDAGILRDSANRLRITDGTASGKGKLQLADATALTDAASLGQALGATQKDTGATGTVAQSFHRIFAGGNLALPVSGQVLMMLVELIAGQTVTNVVWFSRTTALSGTTHAWAGVADSNRLVKATSTDATGLSWASNAASSFAMGTPFTPTVTGAYYFFLMIAATQVPTLSGFANTANGNVGVAAPVLGGLSSSASQTTAPTPGTTTFGAITNTIIGYPYVYAT